ncbi:uncharacterized protein Triagg1_811 [Trichoderma aggressivum f. europaeum]|uniref:NACHT-NTPase and P-loop NTPases N-terminal domain-containing protein n=1 Tax=Trichoderma aggressivum f. europaeum TaxID=173218 RepID=A0AAE1JHI7_9HYPO|nr:hypothetical protein Triagg1_811 [Trichoderma aggressivum f. europaeum]
MSGAELIGIISGIIAIVDASLKIYEAAADASGLPRAFRNVIARLPVIQDTLEAAKDALEEEEEEGKHELSRVKFREALAKILESCYDKATALNKTLKAVMPTQGASKAKRYVKAIKMIPAADKIESLMNGILHDLHVLAANHSVKSATRSQIKDLMDITKKDDKRECVRIGHRATISLYNAGKGSQYIYEGQGNQNVSMGGIQFNGSSTAPLYIGMIR